MCAREGGIQSVGRFAPRPMWRDSSVAPAGFLRGDSATCLTHSTLLILCTARKLTK